MLLVETYLFFVPSRRQAGDARVVALAIGVSAGLWAGASVIVAGSSAIGNGFSWLFGRSWNLDYFHTVIAPALSTHDGELREIAPGLVLSVVAVLSGAVAAHFMLEDDGRHKRLELSRRLVIDSNPRVWTWFLQSNCTGVFRVTLTSGDVYIGQVSQYSSEPEDDLQEIVLATYSKMSSKGPLEDVTDAHGMLIPREQIRMLERLAYDLDEVDGSPVLVEVAPPRRRRPRGRRSA